MKVRAFALWLFSFSIIWNWQGQAVAGNFDWEPFKTRTQFFQPSAPDSAASIRMEKGFQEMDQYLFSFSDKNINTLSNPIDSRGLQFDFRNIKFSISRYALNLDRDHTIRPSDIEKQKEILIDALPSALQFETIGKIFEPNINLHIEF